MEDLGIMRIFAYVSSEVEYSDELIQALVIHKTVVDLKDCMGTEKLTASLMECGTRILFEEPAIPNFFASQADEIFSNIDHKALKVAMKNNFQTKVNEITSISGRRVRKFVLKLPDGMRCKMGFMNPSNTRRILTGVMGCAHEKYSAGNTSGSGVDFLNSLIVVTYTIAIDSEQKIIRNVDIGNGVDDFFKRMSISKP